MLGIKDIFYEIKELKDYDIIVGIRTLRKIKGKINIVDGTLEYEKGIVPLLFNDELLNNLAICMSTDETYIEKLKSILKRFQGIFTEKPSYLPYNTNIVATIDTTTDDPIWSKSYPYPQAVSNFVNNEINNMLENNIIMPSRSAYNSPVWVVDKKGTNEDGSKKHRLVIDYKKLNSFTKSDKYPMSDTSVILFNLGKSKFFTTLDLQSGFHQIMMKKEDREKTAFSVNNGKYEFLRMPFGLKNAPSLFQRAMDDILRPYIGKFCHVYIDDVIIFSESEEKHLQHIEIIIKALSEANMKISSEKSKYFMQEVEFLGYVVSYNSIKTDPKKVKTIREYPEPKTLRQLRSFLGLSGYYRKFIRNYAMISKPLTKYLRDQDANTKSKFIPIELDNEGKKAFRILKDKLEENIILNQPNFEEGFELTTDASNSAIGAVLSQNNKPITFISRGLSVTEEGYATNEKELLAIVWSLKNLRNYLYGTSGIHIYTDHQPLTFAMSDKNPNAKMKRWREFIEEYSPIIKYKPGRENVVADALSRQELNMMDSDVATVHSTQSSPVEEIKRLGGIINRFRNQLIIKEGNNNSIGSEEVHKGYWRHTVIYKDENLFSDLKEIVRKGVNAIHSSEELLFKLTPKLLSEYPTTMFAYVTNIVEDIVDKDTQITILKNEHNRAHRDSRENFKQITTKYYWPECFKQLLDLTRNCSVCKENKYDRHPVRYRIGEAPIPKKGGERIHADIYYIDNDQFLTMIDSFSKFLIVRHIESKIDAKNKLIETIPIFGRVETLVTDNEKTFCTPSAQLELERLGVKHERTAPNHSRTNGMIERVHSTLTEIIRITKTEIHAETNEIMPFVVKKYNESIHSVTNFRPIDVFHNFEKHISLTNVLKEKQDKDLAYFNKNRTEIELRPGEKVHEKSTRRQGKVKPLYKKRIVKEDRGRVILDSKDRIIHKDNLKK